MSEDIKIKELEKQNELLRCCGNCKHYEPCTFAVDKCYQKKSVGKTTGDGLCHKWEVNK